MNLSFKKLNKRIPQIKNIQEKLKCSNLNRIEKQAELLMDDLLIFNRTWDMEPCQEPIDIACLRWDKKYTDDEEWTYMLNRFDYIKSLVIISIVKDDLRYINKAKFMMMDWISKHPLIQAQESTRTLDTGIRILNFIDLSSFLIQYDLLNEDEFRLIQQSIEDQANYLIKNYRPKDTLSNWGLVQVVALLIVHLNFEVELNISLEELLNEFYHQLNIQVLSDGIYWEHSTLYHGVVLEQILKVIQELNYYEIEYDHLLLDKAHDLSYALRMLTLPDGTVDAYGDSDRTDSSDLLNKAAFVLQDQAYCLGDEIDAETLLLFFEPRIYKNKTESLVFNGYESGVFTHRTSFEANANYTQFINSSLGSAHGHGDHLNLTLTYKGQNILVDKGRYTYKEDDFLRPYLKSSSAHNGVLINNQGITKAVGSWAYQSYAQPIANESIRQGNIQYYNGSVNSFRDKLEVHQRQILILQEGIWIIKDRVLREGKNDFKQFFHFDPSIDLEMDGDDILIHHPEVDFKYKNISGHTLKICKTPLSYEYNSKQGTYSLKLEGQFKDKKTYCHVFSDQSVEVKLIDITDEHKTKLHSDMANGLRIKVSSEHYYDIALVHEEKFIGNKNLYIDGYAFYGKVVVIEHKNNKRKLYRFS